MARYGKTHGKHNTKTYKSWQSMKQRCDNKNDPSYERYGGRGISYQDSWQSFEAFYLDMGERPNDCSLDRIDNDLGYTKDNCRWATTKEQTRNRRDNNYIEFNGVSLCFSDWCEKFGLARTTLRNRLNRGWTVERALTEPVRQTGR